MAAGKKDFSSGAAAIFGSSTKTTVKSDQDHSRSSKADDTLSSTKKGLKQGETRRTYIISDDIGEDLESIAYWERQTIKDVVNEALRQYVNNYALDRTHEANVLPTMRIKPIPTK